ncbi:DUF4405 domain-containing protein [Prosthecochloris sp.]|uniref:DUF4405 domain-containing protein n=1 Tax=Prosthecochloris sp. TaxID=290513 RepID=UPI0025DEB3B2|nr:DUF4405 domain-containing protein [Prosthecochloris sp.]
MSATMKSWATPLAAGTFIILAVTGILMFFKVDAGYIKPVHEWLSWAMVIGVLFHTIANWKPFIAYFSRKLPLSIIGAGVIITMLSIVVPSSEKGSPKKNMFRALESAKIEMLADMTGQSSDALIGKLEGKGITNAETSMTIEEIASVNGKKEMEILWTIFE